MPFLAATLDDRDTHLGSMFIDRFSYCMHLSVMTFRADEGTRALSSLWVGSALGID